ncbi:MAG: class I SAM-dependent methyltransferase [Spirochaetes bacterium]|nr:MAG: class I SAM-dependent methyltransferase [Spirochaetota bacterium]
MKTAIARKIFHNVLGDIVNGHLVINYISSGKRYEFGDPAKEPSGMMNITDDSLIYEILTQGEFALGMGYVNGKWKSPSMYLVLLVFMLNEERFRRLNARFSRIDIRARLLRKRIRRRTQNTLENCRREVGVTYGIGNDFYEMMLGPSMNYSCAIWPRPDATLEEAQEYKMRLITRKAKIEKKNSVLEIGCGWGTLTNFISSTTGARVKGIALCDEQIRYCKEKYPQLDFEYLDYREIKGTYDSIVSVGMAEHVGRPYMDSFIKIVADHLREGGRFVLHTMIYHGVDLFMSGGTEKHLNFSSVLMPNADSPTPSQVVKSALRSGLLRLLHYDTFGIHYTRTAQEWLKNMQKNRNEILKRYPEKLYRSHEYSWQMGGAAMETGTSLAQMVFEKMPYGSPLSDISVYSAW